MAVSLPWAVIDSRGVGWGRYATKQEADERAAWLRLMEVECDVVRVP